MSLPQLCVLKKVYKSLILVCHSSLTIDNATVYGPFSHCLFKIFSSRTDKGFDKILSEPAQRKFTSALLEGLKNRNVSFQLEVELNYNQFEVVLLDYLNILVAFCSLYQKFHIPLCFCGFQHTVVRVPGDHHVHLNNPEVIAPFVSDFLRTKVLSQSINRQHKL